MAWPCLKADLRELGVNWLMFFLNSLLNALIPTQLSLERYQIDKDLTCQRVRIEAPIPFLFNLIDIPPHPLQQMGFVCDLENTPFDQKSPVHMDEKFDGGQTNTTHGTTDITA